MKRILIFCLLAALVAGVPFAQSPAEDEPPALYERFWVRSEEGMGAALRLEPGEDAMALAWLYDGAPVSVAPWRYPTENADYLCVSVGTNADGDFVTGYVRAALLTRDASDAALPVATVSGATYLESEGGSISLCELADGDTVTLLGQTNVRYLVRYGEQTGALPINRARLDEAAAAYVSARRPRSFPADDAALETARQALSAYESDCMAKYGPDASEWPLEARTERDTRAYSAGEGMISFSVSTAPGELSAQEAQDCAWQAYAAATGEAAASRNSMHMSVELWQRLSDASRCLWVRMWQSTDGACALFALDSRTGELQNGAELAMTLELMARGQQTVEPDADALAQMEAEKGLAFNFWPWADKLAYLREFSPVEALSYTLPGEGDLPESDALALAKAELRRRYGETVESLAGMTYSVDFFRALYPCDTDDGDTYQFEFYTTEGDFRYTVRIRAGDGKVVALGDYINGNG